MQPDYKARDITLGDLERMVTPTKEPVINTS